MPEPSICPRCGRVKPLPIPGDLCPACLFGTVLAFGNDPVPRADDDSTKSEIRDLPESIRYFGDYELLERIAEGGMGVVYKARQRSLDRLVAVKMIRAGRLADAREVARFRTEATAAAKLKHPHIVPIHEIGEHEGRQYFSLDLLEGGSLAQEVQRHPLAPGRAASVVRTLADAIQYAHDRGVLHRDLKPSNVLLDARGIPHLTDFGLAKVVESGSRLTVTGEMFGTPSYVSPEQAEGRNAEVGPASDVYSLGAILYELLTGRPPFAASSALETIRLVVGQDPSPPRSINPGLPRDLETICLKCLSKKPSDRYASASELRDELDRYLRDEPIRAVPAGFVARARRWCRRRPSLAIAIGATVFSLLVGFVASTVLWLRAEASRALTEHQFYAADVSAAIVLEREGNRAAARSKLDPHRHRTHLHDFAWNYVESRIRGDYEGSFRGHSNAIEQIALSGDGKTLASKDASGLLNVWDTTSFERRYSVEGVASLAGYFPLGEGGLVIGSTNDRVQLLDLATGRVLRSKTEAGLPIGVEPDGEVELVTAWDALGASWDWLNFDREYTRRNSPEERAFTARHPPPDFLQGSTASHRSGVKRTKPTVDAIRRTHPPDLDLWREGSDPPNRRTERASSSLVFPDPRGSPDSGTNVSWNAMAMSADGSRVLVGRAEGRLERYQFPVSTNRVGMRSSQAHLNRVSAMSFLPNGTEFVTGADDQAIRLWSFGSDRPVLTLSGHTERVVAIAASSDGSRLVSGGQHGELLLWDLGRQRGRDVLPGIRVQGRRDKIVFSSDARLMAMRTAEEGWPVVIDVESLSEADRIPHSACINSFSPDGKSLSLGMTSHRRYSVASGDAAFAPGVEFRPVRMLLGAGDAETNVLAKAVSQGERFVAFSLATRGVVVCDGETGDEVVRCRDAEADVTDLAFLEEEGLLATVDASGWASVWDVRAGRRVARFLTTVPGPVPLVLPLRGGPIIATGTGTNRIAIWDYRNGKAIGTLSGHREAVTALAQSADGKTLASGSAGGVVKLWDLVLRQEVASWTLSEGPFADAPRPVRQLAFSPDDRVLAGLDDRGLLRVWRTWADGRRTRPSSRRQEGSPDEHRAVPSQGGVADWRWSGNPEFAAKVDKETRRGGNSSLCLSSVSSLPAGHAILRQRFAADEYRGRRVWLDGYAKARLSSDVEPYVGQGGFGVRVTDETGRVLSSDDLVDRPVVGTNDWTHFRLVVDIPREATEIEISPSMKGIGQVWFDDLALAAAGEAFPLPSSLEPEVREWLGNATLRNPGFETHGSELASSPGLHGWRTKSYSATHGVGLAADHKHTGAYSAHLFRAAASSPPARRPVLSQYLSPHHFAGNGVRVSAYVKTMAGTVATMELATQGVGGSPAMVRTDIVHQNLREWREVAVELRVPADAGVLVLTCGLEAPGDIWFDDFRVSEISGAAHVARADPGDDGRSALSAQDVSSRSPPTRGRVSEAGSGVQPVVPRDQGGIPFGGVQADDDGLAGNVATSRASPDELSSWRFLEPEGFVLGDAGSRPCVASNAWPAPELRPYALSTENRSESAGRAASVLRLESTDLRDQAYGFAIRTISAEPYRGKRFRLEARLRTAGVSEFATLWFGVAGCPDPKDLEDLKPKHASGPSSDAPSPDGVERRSTEHPGIGGDAEWTSCSLERVVPDDARSITCGFVLVGDGTAWMDQPRIRVRTGDSDIFGPGLLLPEVDLPKRNPLALRLLNPGFDDSSGGRAGSLERMISGAPTGWSFHARGHRHLVFSDQALTRTGSGSVLVESVAVSEDPESAGRLFQEIAAIRYRGRRVRWNVYTRSELRSRIEVGCKIRDESKALLWSQQATKISDRGRSVWDPVELVLDVPENAESILVSMGVLGSGKAWFDDAQLRIVAKDTRLTDRMDPDGNASVPSKAKNLDFEEATPR